MDPILPRGVRDGSDDFGQEAGRAERATAFQANLAADCSSPAHEVSLSPGFPVLPSFGTHAPTAMQRAIMSLFHGTVLGRTRLRRAAVRRFKAEQASPVDATLFGHRTRFHPHDNQTDAKAAVCGSSYNRDELRWLRRHLPEGGVFVDVGSNMGFFALAALGRAATIVAIEPMPVLYRRLAVNMALNGAGAFLFNEAAGEQEGYLDLAFGDRDLGSSSLLAKGPFVRVPVRPLSDMLASICVRSVDFMKVDVEGYEDRVLCGFLRDAPARLLPSALVIEHCSRGEWSHDLLGELGRAGYVKAAGNRSNLLFTRHSDSAEPTVGRVGRK